MTLVAPDPFALAAAKFAPNSADIERAETIRQMSLRWRQEARTNQLPPSGDWFVLLFLAGAGWGKTRTGAEWAASKGREFTGCRVALVAPTFADGRDIMVEGESGLLACFADIELRGGSRDTAWNRSLGELYLANGSRYKVYTSERPRQLRGPQHHFAWGDEPAEWADAHLGARATPETDTTWSNLTMRLRLPALGHWPSHYRPQIVLTGTPKRKPLLKSRDENNPGLLQQDNVVVVRGRTDENLANLSEDYVRRQIDPLRGTRLGRQELDAELLEDVEGALWTDAMLERGRVPHSAVDFRITARVVSVDPATTAKVTSDLTGIVVVGCDAGGDGYVLDDRTHPEPVGPAVWAETAWRAAVDWECEAIVVEDNQGGEMVEHTLTSVWPTLDLARKVLPPPIRRVHAVSNKRARATPISTMAEQDPPRVHHVTGTPGVDLGALEDELTSWDGSGDSPDRMDAMVHGLRWLLLPGEQRVDGGRQVVARGRWAGASGRR